MKMNVLLSFRSETVAHHRQTAATHGRAKARADSRAEEDARHA
jgi:hypothetical protein